MDDGSSMRAVWIENQNSTSYADQSNCSWADYSEIEETTQ